MKNIENYKKYDIFFDFRFTENMIFTLSVFFENAVFHAVMLMQEFLKVPY